jgi:valyl-tRNA synthetase
MAGRHHLEIINIMDGSAVINENGGAYQGQDRYECRENVVRDLQEQGYLVGLEPYTHNLGQCYRCKTDVEPFISKQWFVKIQPLAKAANAAVIKGKTRIIPSMWEATYFEWMSNIRDWCISRQIWWGHRIPVWYCDDCGQIIVSSNDPDRCPGCENATLRQDEDVLDTWFSSALWPFSTLGWPDRTEALKTFYPTSLLITGFDILFFWVARMMMMGLYVMKDVPFRDVYLHALVRDEQGDKMSKSKGNSIDPLQMIDKFGADPFRFTLAAFTAQGRDVRMSEERIEGYKFFVNKVWNAAKFSLMNLEDFIEEDQKPWNKADLSLPDRWILARLNRTVDEVIRGLDEYRFNEATGSLYQFVWHEFCDWYLELIKPVLYSRDQSVRRRATQQTLSRALRTILKLMHPFMPFLTEEIWQTAVADGASIMVSPYPEPDESLADEDAERRMGLIVEVITRIRNIRGEMNIAPSKKLRVVISAPDQALEGILNEGRDYIVNLGNLETLTVGENLEEPKGAAVGVVGAARVFVLMEGMIDVAAEKARLEKELSRVDKDLSVVSRKLGNRDFMDKAAEAIIRKEEQKFQDLREKHKILEAAIRKLEAI